MLKPNDVWDIVELTCSKDDSGKIVVEMVDFNPFCPYNIDLDYYVDARKAFCIEEWLDIILGTIDYNPAGYLNNHQKLTMISRLLPFIEKRLNIIELAPKGTGKSYLFSQISKYGWLVSGGSISRAKLFYDINKRISGCEAYPKSWTCTTCVYCVLRDYKQCHNPNLVSSI